MISDESKRKFESIVKNMTPEQRSVLQYHFSEMNDEQKEQLIEKIISTYDKKVANEAPTEQTPYSEAYKEHIQDGPRKKRRLKRKVRNGIIAFVVVVLFVVVACVAYFNRDKLLEGRGTAESVADTVPEETVTPTPEATATPSPTPTVTPTPAPTRVPVAADHPDLTGLTVVIDPGHQQTADEEPELYASWLSSTKPRCTSGTTGVISGVHEYELTLDYSLVLADYLEQCGANVILTREENDVNISNQERAAIATSAQADLFLRIHADAAGDSATSGVRVYIPDSGSYTDTSPSYAQQLADAVAQAEGFEVDRVQRTSLYTGLNYANSIRSFQISLGFLSNIDDEAVLVDEENMVNVAEAISVFCGNFA
ncbi:MAG: N-acetylmuramoyl-L-alanine amidase [Clostridiales bacterium]|nr:N-acetylmuramoyl-L-alanine amidase [Clostridiales bacterium]